MLKAITTKQFFFALMVCGALQGNAQTEPAKTATLKDALKYVKGNKEEVAKAFDIFTREAASGDAQAMNALAIMYKRGMGTEVNEQKALEWYTKAGNAGFVKAWYNLGLWYKDVLNFTKAYESFSKAADLKDAQSIYAKGYMQYKGLGCQQDYESAYNNFLQGALAGKPNSMYFLGLCLRNGYGVAANKDSAVVWLTKSASLGYNIAKEELATSEPENIAIAGALTNEIKAAQKAMPQNNTVNKYAKVENSIPAKDVEGSYSGYLLKYDWSGQHVVSASKLTINLNHKNEALSGQWIEDDTLSVALNALLTPKALVFKNMQYKKISHYNPVNPELLTFEKARLQLVKGDDGVYLSGNLQMFSPERKEPAKPLFIAVKRTTAVTSDNTAISLVNEDGSLISQNTLRAYPNPFTSVVTTDFELKEATVVQTQILALDGKIVYSNNAGKLEAGSYTLPIQTQQIAAGSYLVRLQYGKKVRTAKLVKTN